MEGLNVKIDKEHLRKGMNYFTMKQTSSILFIFVDQCKQTGNVYTFLRKKVYMKETKENIFSEKNINEELSVNSSYFTNVTLYKDSIKIHDQ